METLAYTDTLTVIDCGECGISFAVPETWRRTKLQDHSTFYCPNGHGRVYRGESTEEKLRRQLENANARIAREQADAENQRNRVRSYKGQVTRLKRRVTGGLCPCCTAEFPDLGAHMQSEHPEYSDVHV